jgi:hypothetical protein
MKQIYLRTNHHPHLSLLTIEAQINAVLHNLGQFVTCKGMGSQAFSIAQSEIIRVRYVHLGPFDPNSQIDYKWAKKSIY